MNNRFVRLIQVQVFLLACLPFLIAHHARPIPSFYPELTAFVLGLGLIGSIAWRHGLGFGPTLLSPLLWLVLTGLQYLFGPPPLAHDALGLAAFVLWGIALVAALRQCLVREKEAELLSIFAAGLLCGAAFNALAALLQALASDWPGVFQSFDGSVTGNIGQRNLLASYLMLGTVSAVHLHAAGRLPKAATLALTLLLTAALTLSSARSVLVYTLWIAASVLLVPRFAGDAKRNLAILYVVAGLLAWQLLYPSIAEFLPGLRESMAGRFQAQGMLDGIRRSLLTVAGDMVAGHPLLGAGLGSFDQRVFWQPLAAGDTPYYLTNVEHAHNILAQFAAELGVLALLPLFALLWALHRGKPTESAGRWWGWTAAGLVVLHALLEYPLWYAHFLGLFAVLLAFAVPAERWVVAPGLGLKAAVTGGISLTLIGLALLVADYYRLETYPEKRVPPAQLFRTFNEIAANPLIGQHARGFLAANLSPAPSRIPEKYALCRQAIADFADEAVIRACLPIYELAGHREAAWAMRERLARNIPRDQPTR